MNAKYTKILFSLAIAIAIYPLAGCETPGSLERKEVANNQAIAAEKDQRVAAYLQNNPTTSPQIREAMQKGTWVLGMTTWEVEISYAYPQEKNKSEGLYGKREQWVYLNNVYLYFENGKLTSWQTPGIYINERTGAWSE